MIVESLRLDPAAFEAATGWAIKPEGACRGDICVPLPASEELDLAVVAERLGMPVVKDEPENLYCLGPAGGGRALDSAALPDIALPDRHGELFRLNSLRGRKMLLVAWASW